MSSERWVDKGPRAILLQGLETEGMAILERHKLVSWNDEHQLTECVLYHMEYGLLLLKRIMVC